MAYFVPLPLPDGWHSVQAALTTPDGAHRISPPVTLVFAINKVSFTFVVALFCFCSRSLLARTALAPLSRSCLPLTQTLEYDEDGAAVGVEGEATWPGGGMAGGGGGGGVMPANPELCPALVASLHGPNTVSVASANEVLQ